ncbi:MAG: ABC transporter substrate-binding protein, partial [Spirochaetales bacterium]|nr:ABC transporter substrate-binding protein [Spirochaetales bacterium]
MGKSFKIVVGIFLICLFLLSFSCSKGDSSSEVSQVAGDSTVLVQEPVTVTIWHNRGPGANLDSLLRAIDKFNATNTLGITVTEEYVGGYAVVLTKTLTSIAAGNNPVLVLQHGAGLATLASKGALTDLTPFIERDSYDLNNFIESLMCYSYDNNQVISLPYIPSTAVLYYNKGLLEEAGVEVPTTMEELEVAAKEIHAKTGKFGCSFYISADYIQDAWLHSLGGAGIIDDDNGLTSLDNGSLAYLLDTWARWIDEGWCQAPKVTSQQSAMQQSFQTGEAAMMILSSGGIADAILNAQDAGQDVDVAYMPGFGKLATNIGGGNLAIVGMNHSEQEIAAAWEFMKFITADEQVADNHVTTGYLPTTFSSIETDSIKQFWDENPGYKVAFEQLEWANAVSF